MHIFFNYITWNVSPFIYEGEHFAIGWYGTIVAIAIVAVYLLQWCIYRKEKLPRNYVDIVFIACTVLGTLFCHCFHCWFYEWYDVRVPENAAAFGEPVNFLGFTFHFRNPTIEHPSEWLRIGHGMASHGIDFGMWLGAGLVAKYIFDCSTWWIMDRMVVSRLAFHAISRLSNIFNSEIYGNPTELPWGFIFAYNGDTIPCHPTALYESLLAVVAIVIWWYLYNRTDVKQHIGMLTGITALMLWVPRFFIEFLKPVQQQFEELFALNMGQMLSIPYICIGVILIVYSNKKGKSESGVPRLETYKTKYAKRKK